MNKILSICIPTYNRAQYIISAIESIIKQLTATIADMVEIVVSDNCSTDNTKELIDAYKNSHQDVDIIYHCNDKNEGADYNYLKCIELATGKYCWYLGSDDNISNGSLSRVLGLIETEDTVYLSSRYECKKNSMKIISTTQFLQDAEDGEIFYFNDKVHRVYYFNKCPTLGGVFSYISSIIFNRKSWMAVDECSEYIGTLYVHVAKLFKMLISDPTATVRYIKEPIVYNRTENDSFYVNEYNRIMIDVNGYEKLSEILPDSDSRRSLIAILKREHPNVTFSLIFKLKKKTYNELLTRYEGIGYSKREVHFYKKLRSLSFILAPIWYTKRFFSKIFRRRKKK